MTKLELVEPLDIEWVKWKKDGQHEAGEIVKSFKLDGNFKVKDSLYQRMKKNYFLLFHGKCVYCESPLEVEGWSQLDHFRPKKAALGLNREPIQLTSGKEHPGYYWLAYEWTNLLLSCSRCNGNKGALFPLMEGSFHASEAKDDLSKEDPVLFHPVLDSSSPTEHFGYVKKSGALELKTLRAKRMARILKLNREGLCDARRNSYGATIDLVQDYLSCLKFPKQTVRRKISEEKFRKVLKGIAAYSFVGRVALEDCGSLIRPYIST